MGLFEKIFGSRPRPIKANGDWKTLTAYQPMFRSWNGQIYESELVRAAINAKATHMSKLAVGFYGAARPSLVGMLKKAPNSFQTWSQFLYRLETILECQGTAIICPVLNEYGDTAGIFSLLPSSCKLADVNGEPYIVYEFKNGQKAAMELKLCGIMTHYQYEDDIFGSNNEALRATMELINIQNQAIEEGAKSAATYRFYAQYNDLSFGEDLAEERKRFSDKNFKEDGGGLLLFPSTYSNIHPIDSKPFVLDDKQMAAIEDRVNSYFGVNKDVIQNKAFGDAWSAFYEGAIEPFAIQLSEVLTKMLFTLKERAQGNSVMVTTNRLQYMSNADKLQVSAQMADRGLMTRNEIREIWNLPPLEGELGDSLPIRGEYYNAGEKKSEDDA